MELHGVATGSHLIIKLFNMLVNMIININLHVSAHWNQSYCLL